MKKTEPDGSDTAMPCMLNYMSLILVRKLKCKPSINWRTESMLSYGCRRWHWLQETVSNPVVLEYSVKQPRVATLRELVRITLVLKEVPAVSFIAVAIRKTSGWRRSKPSSAF